MPAAPGDVKGAAFVGVGLADAEGQLFGEDALGADPEFGQVGVRGEFQLYRPCAPRPINQGTIRLDETLIQGEGDEVTGLHRAPPSTMVRYQHYTAFDVRAQAPISGKSASASTWPFDS